MIFKETLNKSSAAGKRIFCSHAAVSKVGNTQSIPPLWIPCLETKSLASSSCRFNQSFLKNRLPLDILTIIEYNTGAIGVWRSLVSRLVRVQEASGSNPDTPTNEEKGRQGGPFFVVE